MKTRAEPNVTRTANPDRTARTRGRIFSAVVQCLDEVGYSETSINRVQSQAQVSRGALTHHFPSKEEMMAQTLERLLAPVRGPETETGDLGLIHHQGPDQDISEDLLRLWSEVINTRPGRALMEILVASRTDDALRQRITPALQAYNTDFNRNIAHLYKAATGEAEDLTLLWSICRSFMRGLHTHAPYEADPTVINKMVHRFARIMAPHLLAIQKETG
ncbi:TetR/AcrR family transcriptional regulator [Rhodobacteraceae bacterium M382]|nr:TetR/AcrR family transcriptional regulator [Rhodobacteraceae bacterium M382]